MEGLISGYKDVQLCYKQSVVEKNFYNYSKFVLIISKSTFKILIYFTILELLISKIWYIGIAMI